MKYFKILFLILVCVCFIGCNEENNDGEKQDVMYTVTFNSNGGSAVDALKVKEGDKIIKPVDPVKENAEFNGWYYNNELFNFDSAVNKNIELKAMWTNYYIVTFKVNDEIVYEEKVQEGKSPSLPDTPIVPGKIFVDWDGDFENITCDTLIEAVFKDEEYYVTFIVDGEDYGRPIKVSYGGSVTLPADPVKEGYNFIGWDKEAVNIKDHIDIYAIFEPIIYSIKYYDGKTELSNLTPVTYTIEDSFSLEIYEKDNLYFNGWYLNNDFLGDGMFCIEKGMTGDLKLYALNVTVNINDGFNWWETTSYETVADAGKGIDEISNLPEIFEQDFYEYLKDNNLLTSEKVAESIRVNTWEAFSSEMTDPKRVWNATSTGGTGAGNGYVSLYLYSEIELDDNNSVIDVRGGFLGTEPYKSKYIGLLDLLCIMTSYKVLKSKYTPLSQNSNASRAGLGFVLDGYFYGTQGIGGSYFSKARNIIPEMYARYSLENEEVIMAKTSELVLTVPSKIGYIFDGWYLDQECTVKLGMEVINTEKILYAGWRKVE